MFATPSHVSVAYPNKLLITIGEKMQYHLAKFSKVSKLFLCGAQNSWQCFKHTRLNTLSALPAKFLSAAVSCPWQVEKAHGLFIKKMKKIWDEHSHVWARPLTKSSFETPGLQLSAALFTSYAIMHKVQYW